LIDWKRRPEGHDYPAAIDYLTLLMDRETAANLVTRLADRPVTHHKAKDILRASGLDLLPTSNAHVAADRAKINAGEKISPILIIRGNAAAGVPAQIADGYHRVCASYSLDENENIPCQIITLDQKD